MDNHQDETTTFEVTVTSDGVSTSGISSPQVVLATSNTLSWGINECSSSFQSVSSCETLESYDPNATTTTAESPQVIVVPFIADSEMSGGTVLANNGAHIPLIKECSIRIDQLKMTPTTHCADGNVEKIIELPFSTNGPSDDSSAKNQLFCLSDDESTVFEGFGLESLISTEYDMYKNAVNSIKQNANQRDRHSSEPVLIEHHSNDVIIINDPILTERILTERHLSHRPPMERATKTETMKRPRQIQRKVAKSQIPANQNESTNQSRIENTENNVAASKPNNVVKPVVPATDRVTSTPVQNVDMKSNKKVSSSDSSDSDVIVAPLDESETKKKVDQSADIKNNNKLKEKELRRAEKMRRRKELSQIAERIRDHWRETFAAARRKQRKKARKNKTESSKHKNYYTKTDNSHHHRHGKRKRISCSSDSDPTDSSSSSRTSGSSSSDSDSDSDSNDSDTTTSYTSQTSYTRTESDSTDDTDSSDSSYHRYYKNRRINRCRRSPSSDSSSDTSSSDDDDYETYDNRRKFHLLKKSIYKRKQSKSKSDESGTRSRKRKTLKARRSDEATPKKRKLTKNVNRGRDDSNKGTKSRTTSSQQRNQKFDYSSRSSASSAKVRKTKPTVARRSRIESTSAGDFSVKQCDFE